MHSQVEAFSTNTKSTTHQIQPKPTEYLYTRTSLSTATSYEKRAKFRPTSFPHHQIAVPRQCLWKRAKFRPPSYAHHRISKVYEKRAKFRPPSYAHHRTEMSMRNGQSLGLHHTLTTGPKCHSNVCEKQAKFRPPSYAHHRIGNVYEKRAKFRSTSYAHHRIKMPQ